MFQTALLTCFLLVQVDAAFFHEVLLVLGSDEVRRGDMNIPAAALEQLYKTYRLAKLSLAKMPTVIPSGTLSLQQRRDGSHPLHALFSDSAALRADLLLALVGSSFVPPLTGKTNAVLSELANDLYVMLPIPQSALDGLLPFPQLPYNCIVLLAELAEPSMLPAIAEAQLSSALEPIRTADGAS